MNARLLRTGRWLLGLLVVVPQLAGALDCPVGHLPGPWKSNCTGNTYIHATRDDMITACEAGLNGNANLYFEFAEDLSYPYGTDDGDGNIAYQMYFRAYFRSSNAFQGTYGYTGSRPSPATQCTEPPPEVDCATLANVKTLGHADDQPDSFVPGDTICVKSGQVGGQTKVMNCAAFKLSTQKWHRMGPTGARDHLVRYQFTGLECDQEPQQPETEPTDTDHQGERCTSSNGLQFCTGKDYKEGCGFFNDKYVCVESLDKGNCETKADGSRLCGSTAPTPPVPDNGTPGNPAPPDATMEVCTGAGACTQYNYYNSTTATGSSRDPGSGGNTDGSGTVGPGGTPAGTGDGEGEDPTADDSASGGTTCEAAPTCEGDPIACAVLAQQWRTRCTANPTDAELEASFGPVQDSNGDLFGTEERTIGSLDASGWMGGGACVDDYTVNMGSLLGTYTIPFSELCQLLQFIGMFVMVSAYVGGAKIILGGI